MEIINLKITGLHCAGCVATVERALSRVPGVEDVVVDLKAGKARIRGSATPEHLVEAVDQTGYEAKLIGLEAENDKKPAASWLRRIFRSGKE